MIRPQDPSIVLNYGGSTKLRHRILMGQQIIQTTESKFVDFKQEQLNNDEAGVTLKGTKEL